MIAIDDFLATKPLYYKEIDHQRVHKAYTLLSQHIKRPKTIHVVGTNAKGSTGRMVAHLAYRSGASVGHFTSPHILHLSERFWLNGLSAKHQDLEMAHQTLFKMLGQEIAEALSYFEYCTLLALVLFESCDLLVLEAGLGGEYDATNVSAKEMSIFTPIDYDHQAFLGERIEEIATTKLNSMQKSGMAVIAPQQHKEVFAIASAIAKQRSVKLVSVAGIVDENSIALLDIAKQKAWPNFLVTNALVALEALSRANIPYKMADLLDLELFGRYSKFKENIHLDVGHNPLAANALVEALEKNTVLIYNSLEDKDYFEVLRILKPKIKRVEIISIESQRAIQTKELEQALNKLGIEHSVFKEIEADEHYLVFGSFHVVEAFLKCQNIKRIDVSK